MRRRLKPIGRVFHRLVVIAAVASLVLSGYVLWILIFEPDRAERLTSGVSPVQFTQRLLDADKLDSYGEVFAIAHNAGDSLASTREALEHGADVIEIDVVSLDGRLYAAHDTPERWYSSYVFRGPSLEQVWRASADAAAVEFDLKESSSIFIDRVIAFLQAHQGEQDVIISSPDPMILAQFAERTPEVYLLLSIGTVLRLNTMQQDPARLAGVDGVSIRASLLDRGLVEWFAKQKLLVMAWTVDDLATVNRLVEWGVDAITTNNLNLMELLGSDNPETLRLDRYRAEESEAETDGEEPEDGAGNGGEEHRPTEPQVSVPNQEADLDVVVVLGDEPGDDRHQGSKDDEPDRPAVLAVRPADDLDRTDRPGLRPLYG